jgi:hypothetical protein
MTTPRVATLYPDAMQALQTLKAATEKGRVPALAALILAIASINVWNRLNVAVAQVAGEWKP